MKANKAPEKIYVDSKAIGDDISTTVHTKRQDYPTCTEYTHTDAFIENACVWIKENLLKHTYVYEGEVSIGMAVFLEDFKQAMKGE